MLKSTGAEAPQTSANPSNAISRGSKSDPVRMGVVGYGYWGPNIVRNFHAGKGSHVIAVCDNSSQALNRVQQSYPNMVVTSESRDLLTSPEIDAIAIVT